MGIIYNDGHVPQIPLTKMEKSRPFALDENTITFETKQQYGRYYKCPNCEGFVVFATYHYCPQCGVRIVYLDLTTTEEEPK